MALRRMLVLNKSARLRLAETSIRHIQRETTKHNSKNLDKIYNKKTLINVQKL